MILAAFLLIASAPDDSANLAHDPLESAIVAAPGDAVTRADRLSFLRFDRATRPDLLRKRSSLGSEEVRTAAAIESVAQYLQLRTAIRAAATQERVPFLPRVTEPSPRDLERVERVFREAVEEHFARDGRTGSEVFPRAFKRFAAGELAIDAVDGVPGRVLCGPDGDYLLLFAEAASFFIDEGQRADYWRPLLTSLIEGSEIYARVPVDTSAKAELRLAHVASRAHPAASRELILAAPTDGTSDRARVHASLAFIDEIGGRKCLRALPGGEGGQVAKVLESIQLPSIALRAEGQERRTADLREAEGFALEELQRIGVEYDLAAPAMETFAAPRGGYHVFYGPRPDQWEWVEFCRVRRIRDGAATLPETAVLVTWTRY